MPPAALTVTAVTLHIRQLLEQDDALRDLQVLGEVSNWKRAASGHIYFRLKDSGAAINAVMWKNAAQAQSWLPREGDQVVAHGYVGVYPENGAYQLYVNRLQPAGKGQLYAALRGAQGEAGGRGALRRRTQAADSACTAPHRRRDQRRCGRAARYPARAVGALAAGRRGGLLDAGAGRRSAGPHRGRDRDRQSLQPRRWSRSTRSSSPAAAAASRICGPSTTKAWHAPLPPAPSPPSPASATRSISPSPTSWPTFARRRHRPPPPAPCPTAPRRLASCARRCNRCSSARRGASGRKNARWRNLRRRLDLLHPRRRLDEQRQRLDDRERRLHLAVRRALARRAERRLAAAQRLESLNPSRVLQRGYSIVRRRSGEIVVDPAAVSAGEPLDVRAARGSYGVVVASEG